jgi:hypothetical protein
MDPVKAPATAVMEAINKKPLDSMSDDDYTAIARQAAAEVDAEKAGKEVEVEAPEAPAEDKPEAPAEDKKPDTPPAENDEAVKAEKEKAVKLGLKEDATKEEVEAAEKKLKDEDFQKEVTEYAKIKNIKLEDAKNAIESFHKIKERLTKSEREVLEEHVALQRSNVNLGRELKTIKDKIAQTPPQELTLDNVMKNLKEGKFTKADGKPITAEEAIEAYREKNPDICENLDDNAVLKLVADKTRDILISRREAYASEVISKAKERKEKLIADLGEGDKEFVADFKDTLDGLSPQTILSEDFNIGDIVQWAKGKHYDSLKKDFDAKLKEAEERGFKRGTEQAKILGLKQPPAPGQPNKGKGDGVSLTESEKTRAKSMFDGQKMTEDEMFKAYREIYPLKEKK